MGTWNHHSVQTESEIVPQFPIPSEQQGLNQSYLSSRCHLWMYCLEQCDILHILNWNIYYHESHRESFKL